MPLSMLRPQRHRTGVWRLRLAVPRALRDACYQLYGSRYELIANLHTRDYREARLRAAPAEDMLRQKLEVARKHSAGMPARLSDRQIAVLAGVICGRELATLAEIPGNTAEGRNVAESPLNRLDGPDDTPGLRKADLNNATALLIEHGFVPDNDAVRRVAEAVWRARVLAARLMIERVDGRWGPGENGVRYPALEQILDQTGSAASTSGAVASLDALLSGWAADRGWTVDMKSKPHVLYDYIRVVERIAGFVGHRDACRIDKAEVVRWKSELQSKGRHAGTIRHIMSCCRALWGWGIRHGFLSGPNIWDGLIPPPAKHGVRGVRPFTDAEAARLLVSARAERGFLRWAAWLLCCTGARISEVAQLVREDVCQMEGIIVIRITDEPAGDGTLRTVKTAASRRTIPIHSALIHEGFLEYVRSIPPGTTLWADLPPDRNHGSRGVTASRVFGQWVRRLGLTDTRLSPAHSLRHRWVDVARAARMHLEIRSAISGHSARRDESAGYGVGMGSMIAILAEAMESVKMPDVR